MLEPLICNASLVLRGCSISVVVSYSNSTMGVDQAVSVLEEYTLEKLYRASMSRHIK